ncbi:hypothetical protein B0H10DRAFT_2025491 [Mycena sp. CBHHK59/15]|nr:hypothetical protein B0H10DRAFT_2025491 [Mycena sp. CBHHK59/15]
MDDQAQSEPEFTTETTYDEDRAPPDRYTGAFFPKGQHFVVTGGRYESVTHIYQTSPSDHPDFRVIPLGDLNLLHPIGHQDGSAVVRRQGGRASVRRMYNARIRGLQSSVTAAVYQGDGAEEEWREEISRYSNLRHPNLLQLYVIVHTHGLHAAIFHDDMIPCTELQKRYYDSHFLAVYFWAYLHTAVSDVNRYMLPFSGKNLQWSEYIVWIRPSTGRLCIDLTPPQSEALWLPFYDTHSQLFCASLLEPPGNSAIIPALSLHEYHAICYFHLGWWCRFSTSKNVAVRLGSVRHFHCPEYEDSFEIAYLPDCAAGDVAWSIRAPLVEDHWIPINCNHEGTSMMENGWLRVNSDDVADVYRRQLYSDYNTRSWPSWLVQANHIFHSLDIASNVENYAFVHIVEYWLEFSAPTHDLPSGYLFLCPLADLQSDLPTCFRIPDCPAYWSLDPSGTARLCPAEARNLGFPDIKFGMEVFGRSWDGGVYDGIRQFHEAKGFVPDSQEVALTLGCPLYQVACERDALFAYMQETDPGNYYYWNSDIASADEDLSESVDEQYDFYSDSVEDYPDEDFSESGDEQYESDPVNGDTSPPKNDESDPTFCNAMEAALSSGDDTILPKNEGPREQRRICAECPSVLL